MYPTLNELNKIRTALTKGEIQQAINELLTYESNFKDQVTLIAGRFSVLKKRNMEGTIESEAKRLEENRTISSMIDLINKMALEINLPNSAKNKSGGKQYKELTFKEINDFNRKKNKNFLINDFKIILQSLFESAVIEIKIPEIEDKSHQMLFTDYIGLINRLRLEYNRTINNLDPELNHKQKVTFFEENRLPVLIETYSGFTTKLRQQGYGVRVYSSNAEHKAPSFIERQILSLEGFSFLGFLIRFNFLLIKDLVYSKIHIMNVVVYQMTPN